MMSVRAGYKKMKQRWIDFIKRHLRWGRKKRVEAAAIGIIGSADGPTSIFITNKTNGKVKVNVNHKK